MERISAEKDLVVKEYDLYFFSPESPLLSLSLKTTDSIDKNSTFPSQSSDVCGLSLPQLVSFCYFNTSVF